MVAETMGLVSVIEFFELLWSIQDPKQIEKRQNINQFMSEEERNIDYTLIEKEIFENRFVPSANEVFEYYNNNSDLFVEKEKRSFLQFNFKTLNNAEKFIKKIENIDTYGEVLSYSNKENIKYNLFDYLTKDEVLEEIGQYLFNWK